MRHSAKYSKDKGTPAKRRSWDGLKGKGDGAERENKGSPKSLPLQVGCDLDDLTIQLPQ